LGQVKAIRPEDNKGIKKDRGRDNARRIEIDQHTFIKFGKPHFRGPLQVEHMVSQRGPESVQEKYQES
jgi:hypothetical protein